MESHISLTNLCCQATFLSRKYSTHKKPCGWEGQIKLLTILSHYEMQNQTQEAQLGKIIQQKIQI